jgi:hypothetical protein
MKHLKSTANDLRRLFERAISIREIAEKLVSFDVNCDANSIRAFMDAHNYDAVGLREDDVVIGYVRRENLGPDPVRDHICRFTESDLVAESDSLLTAFEALRERNELFVTILGKVGAIVTKGDLQKIPVRLWLFGIISLIEMQMLRLIRERFPDGAWKSLLPSARFDAAKKLFDERKRRNEEASTSDFADCLQICDKAQILLRDSELLNAANFPNSGTGKKFFSRLESLRNDLAHANDILKGRWPELAVIAEESEGLLMRLETCHPKSNLNTVMDACS